MVFIASCGFGVGRENNSTKTMPPVIQHNKEAIISILEDMHILGTQYVWSVIEV